MRLIDANKIYDAVERRYQVSSGIEQENKMIWRTKGR